MCMYSEKLGMLKNPLGILKQTSHCQETNWQQDPTVEHNAYITQRSKAENKFR